ncbi:MAG: DUF4349 domain-containing protein [Clostridiales bacterium]|nr:DUF4349 domain-containing protein [Clostridiales bacterium]
MKKKLMTIILAAALIITLAGCGSSSADSGATDTVATADYGETATEDTVTEYNSDGAEMSDADLGYTEEAYSRDTVEETADASGSSVSTEVSESAAASGSSDSNTDNGSTDSESEGSADSDSYEQKLIRTVNVDLETTEFDDLVTELETRTEEIGGYVESSEVSSYSSEYTSRWASLTVRVPAASLDEFVSMVGENANVTHTTETTENVTLTYVDLESHLTALRTEQESLLGMLEAAETTEDIIAIQSQLTEVRYEIESYESQLRVYDNKVDYSTVYLYIDEVERETAAVGGTFWGSVGTKFKNNLYRVGQGFRNFAITFLGALPVTLIIVVPIVVICYVIVCFLKRRKERRKSNPQEKRRESNPQEQTEDEESEGRECEAEESEREDTLS